MAVIDHDTGIVAHYTPTLAPRAEVYGLPAGMTVRECVDYLGARNARVMLWDGQVLPEDGWDSIRLARGNQLIIRQIPQGGGGGDKSVGRTLAIVGIAVLSAGAGAAVAGAYGFASAGAAFGAGAYGAGLAATAASIAVGYAGMMAANQLFPPPQPDTPDATQRTDQLGIEGQRNRARPYEPIRRVFGRHRVKPDLAARPYTELVGQDQYLRMLMCVAYGPLDISDIKIGETPIDSYDAEYQVRDLASGDSEPTLFTQTVTQTNYSVTLQQNGTGPGSWIQRTTEPDTDEISLEITFPAGLLGKVTFGSQPDPLRAEIELEYRAVGSSTWNKLPTDTEVIGPNTAFIQDNSVQNSVTDASSIIVTRKRLGRFRVGVRWEVANGQYEVRMRRYATWNVAGESEGGTSASDIPDWRESRFENFSSTWYYYFLENPSNSEIAADSQLTAIKSISHTSPIASSGPAQECVYIALRIRATDQLNGTIDQLSCLAEAKLPIYNGSSWTSPQLTRNAAWAYAAVLRDNEEGVSDSQLDGPGLKAWADHLDSLGFTFDAVIEQSQPVHDLLRKIAGAGRAQVSRTDGTQWTAVVDKERTQLAQVFTPRNMTAPLSSSKQFTDPLEGVKVEFANADKGYKRDQRLVFDDGYDESTATNLETIKLYGCTDGDQAWKHGRYWLAVQRLRPEVYEFEADFESLVCQKGDMIGVSHDVPMWGLKWARIKSVVTDGAGDVTSATLDETVTMASGTDYGALIRLSDLTTVHADVTNNPGDQTTISFESPVTGPDAGDLLLFGERDSEYVELVIKEIEPHNDRSATITALDHSPAIFDADTGTIPAFDSQITFPEDFATRPPPQPVITKVVSDETALIQGQDGSLQERIKVSVEIPDSGDRPEPAYYELQWRLTPETDDGYGGLYEWQELQISDPNQLYCYPVEQGESYDARVRTVSEFGYVSDFAVISDHTVVGKSTPPPAPTYVNRNGDTLLWGYPSPPIDFAGFRVRINSGTDYNWESADPFIQGLVTTQELDISRVLGGQRTFLIRAEDTSGNQSESGALATGFGDRLARNVVIREDYDAQGFPGTITGGTVASGELAADDDSSFFGGDTALFFGADADAFFNTNYSQLIYQTSFVPEVIDSATGEDLRDHDLALGLDITAFGESVRVEWRPGGTLDPFFGSDSDLFFGTDPDAAFFGENEPDWSLWPGELGTVNRQQYEWRVTIAGGTEQGRITQFEPYLDVADLRETLEDVTVAGGQTTLSPNKTYIKITGVRLTLQDDGGDARGIALVDKDRTGPTVRTYDEAGVLTAGTIDAEIQGY